MTGHGVDRVMARLAPPATSPETAPRSDAPLVGATMLWTAEAEERLRRIPLRPVREMVVRRTEVWARARGLDVVDASASEAARMAPG